MFFHFCSVDFAQIKYLSTGYIYLSYLLTRCFWFGKILRQDEDDQFRIVRFRSKFRVLCNGRTDVRWLLGTLGTRLREATAWKRLIVKMITKYGRKESVYGKGMWFIRIINWRTKASHWCTYSRLPPMLTNTSQPECREFNRDRILTQPTPI